MSVNASIRVNYALKKGIIFHVVCVACMTAPLINVVCMIYLFKLADMDFNPRTVIIHCPVFK